MVAALKILHIAFAAAWFGHKLLVGRDVKESVHSMKATDLLIARVGRAERFGQLTGFGTLLTGLGLIYLTTGFAEAPVRIYFGLAAVVVMILIGASMARPAWNTISEGLHTDDPVKAAEGVPQLRRALLLENLLWLVALGTMVSVG